jgi:DNA-binding response OmpR family regulator
LAGASAKLTTMTKAATILVADDEPAIRTLLEVILTSDGYEVATAADGREVMGYLKENTPDLIILDVSMPYADGLELCARIKAISRFQATPVLILTAYGDERTRTAAQLARADGFVNKPLSGKNLRQTVRDLIASGVKTTRIDRPTTQFN